MKDITFYIACWGALLSTVKAVMDFMKGRKEIKASLKTIAEVQTDKKSIKVSFINTSYRPLTILQYDVLYAMNREFAQLIKSYELETPIRLNESETYRAAIPVSDLLSNSKIEQKYYHRLFIRVWTTSLGDFYQIVDIPKDENDEFGAAGLPFILTDRLLGLPEQKPFIHRRSDIPIK